MKKTRLRLTPRILAVLAVTLLTGITCAVGANTLHHRYEAQRVRADIRLIENAATQLASLAH